MSNPQTRILRRADAEIGYSRWSDPQRGTKYARETQPALWPRDHWLLANGISYCDIFITWVFWKENLLDILPAGASYNTDYRASKGGRVPRSQAAPGDVLVFDWNWGTASTNHVGILEKVLPSGNYQTIEGNTSTGASGSQSNGGKVARRVRRPAQVRYVIRPEWYKAIGVPTGGASVTAPKPRPVATRDGKLIVDGKIGPKTARALQEFLNNGRGGDLVVDGKIGAKTWAAFQAYVRAPYRDGEVSRQSYRASEIGSAITGGWEYTGRGSTGSPFIELVQSWVGVKEDGIAGPATVRALQRKLNVHIEQG